MTDGARTALTAEKTIRDNALQRAVAAARDFMARVNSRFAGMLREVKK